MRQAFAAIEKFRQITVELFWYLWDSFDVLGASVNGEHAIDVVLSAENVV